MRAGLGRRLPQRRAALLEREAPGRGSLVETVRRVGRLDPDALDRHVQLVGTDPCERRTQALSELDLAGEQRDRVRRVDAHPEVELGVAREASRQPGHAASLG